MVKTLRANVNLCSFFGVAVASLLFSFSTFAQSAGPGYVNLSGELFSPNGQPITSPNVTFKIEILDKNATCIIYSEQHNSVDLQTTKGSFSLQVGLGNLPANNWPGTVGFDPVIFQNAGTPVTIAGCAVPVTFNNGDNRIIRVLYDLGGGLVTMTPDVPVTSAPYAMVAQTVQGKAPTDFIMTNNSVSSALVQANVETIFTNNNYPKLLDLINGTSTQYMQASPSGPVNFNNQLLTGVADPTAAQDAATKNYADTNIGGFGTNISGIGPGLGQGKTLIWDAGQDKWVTSSVGSVASVTAGNGLTGGTITNTGTLAVDAGITANKIIQLDVHAQMPAVDSFFLTNVNAVQIQSHPVSTLAPIGGQVFMWNATTNVWEPQTPSGGTITALHGDVSASGSGDVAATIQNNVINAPKINSGYGKNQLLITDNTTGQNIGYATCAAGQVLQWTVGGWACTDVSTLLGTPGTATASAGTATAVSQISIDAQGRVTSLTNVNIAFPVTSVAGRTGDVVLNSGDIGGLGTAATKDAGTLAGNVPTLAANNQLPALDGFLLSNVNANFLQSRPVSASNPSAGQVLGWNANDSQWEPMLAAVGSVTNIQTGNGLTGGPITTRGTISVNAGIGPNQIIQLDNNALFPVIDGSQVTNVNAVRIGSHTISNANPSPGQYMGWNTSTSQWEPMATVSGTVTNIGTGNGLLGGPISGTGTISVNTGVGANQIVQLNTNAQYPGVDGNLISNINAVKLQTRDVSATAPNPGQVLGWNVNDSLWEPMSVTQGTVTTVNSGTGLLGGPFSSNGTLSVDVGTSANQVLQLDVNAKIPAVDGYQLSNLNATRIGTHVLATTNPIAGQYIGWNTLTSQWEPMATTMGTVTNITSGTGLTGGPITANGTLKVDVGTAANKILQVTTSTQYPGLDGNLISNINAVKLQTRDVSASAPAGGQMLGWNANTNVWEPSNVTNGTVVSIISGSGLLGGPITNLGTLSVDTGLTANKILQLSPNAQIPGVDGFLVSNVNAKKLQGVNVSANVPGGSQVLTYNSTTFAWEPQPTQTNGNVFVNGGNSFGGQATLGTLDSQSLSLITGSVSRIAIDQLGNVGVGTTSQLFVSASGNIGIGTLTPNALVDINGTMRVTQICDSSGNNCKSVAGGWGAGGSVSLVSPGTGLTGGNITTNGTLNVDVGTTANKILQLDVNAKVPAVDGYQLSNLNATRIGTHVIATSNPSPGQYIGWNTNTSQWEPMATTVGTVTNISSGTGLTGGPITANGTLNVDVGTAANKILQVTPSAQYPGLDGFLVSNVNAVKLQARNVSAGVPVGGQMLGWNANTNVWEPSNVTNGTVVSITSGRGLLGGPITNDGTLSVDVGSAANQILQLDVNAKVPAVDGYQLSNLNATRIGTHVIASSNPSPGQYIGWNTLTSQWEPMATTVGTVTNITSGTGLTGGPITNNGTLNVDIGTGANKIMQLTPNAQAPGVDGFLLTNINAASLHGFPLTASPTGTAATPAYSFSGSTNTGLFSLSAGTLGLASAGTQRLNIDQLGNVGIGTTSVLYVSSSGNIGIGTLTPNALLDVEGIMRVSQICDSSGANCKVVSGGWGAGGSVNLVSAGTGLTGGNITTYGTLNIDVGSTANKIMQVSVNGQAPGVDGNLLTNVTASNIRNRNVSASAPADTQVLIYNSTTATWNPSTLTGDVTITNNGGVTVAKIQGIAVVSGTPGASTVLTYNGTLGQWQALAPASNGTVTDVVGGTGMTGGPVTGTGTLGVDVGTTANKIMQLTVNGQAPGVDGNLLSNITASKLQGYGIVAGTPGASSVLTYNATIGQWQGLAPASNGTVTDVVGGTGMTGGPVTGTGTLGVDVGTTANKILQLTVNAQAPGVDGNLLTNVTASNIRNRNVSASAPADAQVLIYNSTTATWNPSAIAGDATITNNGAVTVAKIQGIGVVSGTPGASTVLTYNSTISQWQALAPASSGTVTDVVGGTGMTGGPVTGTGTLGVDVGTTANKILQLTVNSQAPAVDGFLLTNINAASLHGFPLTASPTGTAASPAYSFSGSTNTGLFSLSAGTLGLASAGTQRLNIDQLGNVGIGTTSVLYVSSSGNIGVGTLTPNALLDVEGIMRVSQICDPSGANCKVVSGGWGAGGSVNLVAAGTGLTGGNITTYGTLNIDVGTAANKILQLTVNAQAPGVDGNLLTNVTASNIRNRNVSASAPADAQVLIFNSTTATWNPSNVNGDASITNNGAVTVAKIQGIGVVSGTPGASTVLTYNSTLGQWQALAPASSGTVTDVVGGTGMTGGPVTGTGTLGVDVGTTANKIMQLTVNGQAPGVDGNLLSNITASKIQGYGVVAGTPGASTVLTYNSTIGQWQALAPASNGTVTDVVGGTGMTGGPVTGTGTLGVDVGTTANKILQLTVNAQAPGVDGNLLTNVTASNIRNRNVSASAPADAQVLIYNSTTGTWNPSTVTGDATMTNNGAVTVAKIQGIGIVSGTPGASTVLTYNSTISQWQALAPASSGTVTDVVGGIGMTGGPVTGTGTLGVDVGTTANKILQLTVNSQAPAVDGFLLTNINAASLHGFPLTASPTGTAAAPAYSFSGSTSTGLFSLSAGTLGLASAGTQRLNIDQLGNVGIGTTSALYVSSSGNIGVGTLTPNALLDVEGIMRVSQICDPSGANCKVVSGGWGAGGSVNLVSAGTGLTGGNITTYGTINIDVGSAANKIMQVTVNGQAPGMDGNLLTNITASNIRNRNVSASAPADAQVLIYNSTTATWNPSNVNGDASITNNGAVTVAKIQGIGVVSGTPGASTVLTYNSTLGQWQALAPASNGTVTDVVGGTGMTGGPVTGTGTLAVDVGTTANKIMQLTVNGQAPGVDGNLLSNITASKIQGYGVVAGTPGASSVLTYNSTIGQWQALAPASNGTVTDVVGGTGMTGGPVTGTGTLGVDVGTTANKILQLTVNAQAPGVDGNLLTNVTASNIRNRNVSASAPADAQVLIYNNTTATWNPSNINGDATITNNGVVTVAKIQGIGVVSGTPGASTVLTYNGTLGQWQALAPASSGTVTDVVGGTGMTGGPVTGTGTLGVDVGTVANKILQLTVNAQAPAVDGFLLTNINAASLHGFPLTASPTGTAAAPAYSFSGSTNTGLFSLSAGNLGLASAGTQRFNIDQLGNIGIGTTSVLYVSSSGNIGVGTLTPNALLDVEGIMRVSQICDTTGANCKAISSGWGAGGSVNLVSAGTGLTGGNITTYGTINIDVGSTANKIMQLTVNGQAPGVDGNLLSNITASKIQGYGVVAGTPGASTVLTYNSTISQWQALAPASNGTVTDVVAGTGMTGGPVIGTGTLGVDVGTTANKILQLTVGAQAPGVDGNLLTNISASNIRNRNVSASAPADTQVLIYNSTTATWNPSTVTGDASLTNNGAVTVAKIQGVGVVSGTPGASAVLTYNSTISQWQALAPANNGSVTDVVGGTGMTGGPVTGTGTLGVDVGTTANKIMQLTVNGQAPAVDGYLLTNITASNIRNHFVSATAPTDGQVLIYNATTATWVPESHTGDVSMTNLGAVTVAKIQGVGVVSGTPGASTVLTYNSTISQWQALAPASNGTVTDVVAGTGMTGGPVIGTGTLGVDVGTTANKILQLTVGAQAPGVDGNLLTNISASNIRNRNVSASAPADTQVLIYNSTTATWNPSTVTGDASLTNNGAVTVAKIQGVGVVSGTPGASTVLTYNSTISQWQALAPANNGSVTDVVGGTGMTGGPVTGTGTLGVDVGTTANKIMQLTVNGQAPAVDGNLLTNINAWNIRNRNVSASAPADTQVLIYNSTTATWNPSTFTGDASVTNNGALTVAKIQGVGVVSGTPGASTVLTYNSTISQWQALAPASNGTVTDVVAGTGMTGGPVIGTGTLGVDVGTTANKIMQLTVGAQAPGVDGNLLTNITASNIRNRNVSASAPADTQVLIYNGTTSTWNPSTVTGDASITNNGAVTVAKIQGITVVSGTPGASTVLTYNSTISQWQALAPASNGTVTDVVAGTGMTGGPVIGTGTLGVDIGTTANKIMQLTVNAQAPAVDGFLLTNINAASIHAFPLIANGTGTAAAPAYSFNGSTNTGLYSASAGTLALASAGTQRLKIDQLGNVGIGTTSQLFVLASTGSVGIGTITPNAALDIMLNGANSAIIVPRDTSANRPGTGINGMIRYNTNLSKLEAYINGWTSLDTSSGTAGAFVNGGNSFGANASLGTNDGFSLNLQTGGIPRINIDQLGNVGIGTTSQLYVSQGGNVGIGTISPFSPLTVNGATSATAYQINGANVVTTAGNWTAVGVGANPLGSAGQPTTAVGVGSLSAGGGWGDVAVGYDALQLTVGATSWFDTAVGAQALQNSTGNLNTAVGFEALQTLTTGNGNIALGDHTGFGNGVAWSGSGNTFIGQGVGYMVQTGASNNTLVGSSAGRNITTGANNTLIGLGNNNITTGSNNIGLGYNLNFPSATGSYQLNIGGLIYGNTNLGMAGIGVATPSAGLDIATTGTLASAVIVPRDTSANRPSTPVNGMIRYNTNLSQVEIYASSAWSSLVTTGGVTGLFANGGNSFSGTATLGTNDGNSLILKTGGTQRMNIDQLGNVGIGTTSQIYLQSSTGNVGIGTTTPGVALEVNGGIRAGASTTVTAACGSGQANNEGTQRYNYTTHNMEYCNGSAWTSTTPQFHQQNITYSSTNGGNLSGCGVASNTNTCTFTTPTGTTTSTVYKFTIVGGGGGGVIAAAGQVGFDCGGAAGGTAYYLVSGLAAGTTVTVAVGNGGAGVSTNTGNAGVNSSIQFIIGGTTTTVTANAGAAATSQVSASGAVCSAGGSTSITNQVAGSTYTSIPGGDGGTPGAEYFGGQGGASTFGGGGSGSGNEGAIGKTAASGQAYGSGGGSTGDNSATYSGGSGAAGVVITEWVQ